MGRINTIIRHGKYFIDGELVKCPDCGSFDVASRKYTDEPVIRKVCRVCNCLWTTEARPLHAIQSPEPRHE